MIAVSLVVIGGILILFDESSPIILGYLFGLIISMLNLKLLDNTINKAIKMSPAKASGYSMGHFFLRYFIYFIVLSVSALADYLNFLAAVIGLLVVKFVIYISTILDKNFKQKN